MDLKIDNKVVIITGGGKGIGRGISEVFAEEKAKVVILSRASKATQDFFDSLIAAGTDALLITGDLTQEGYCKNAIEKAVSHFGRIDILINNAGINDGVGLEAGIAAFRQSLTKNIDHVYELAHHALPYLKESRGNIVNITSKVADTGQGGTSGYAASKGAMNALTREWALDLAQFGIRVNAVVPAEVMTPLYQAWLETLPDADDVVKKIENMIPLGKRMTTSREIANMTAFVASDLSSHTTGQILYVDGGYVHMDRKYTSM